MGCVVVMEFTFLVVMGGLHRGVVGFGYWKVEAAELPIWLIWLNVGLSALPILCYCRSVDLS